MLPACRLFLRRKSETPFLNMIKKPWKKIYGSAVIAANLRGQRRVPFLPREKLEATRDRRIRNIVSYAAKKVPYYRDLFAREHIDPEKIRSAGDLDRLPVIDKELVRKQPHLFIAETSAGKNALSFFSSGSTGTPMEIYHDQHSLLTNIAFGERERESVIRICGGSFRPKELYVGYETSTFRHVVAFYEESVFFPVRPQRRFVSMLEPIEKIAALANTECPDILVGYGGWIHLFFKIIGARRIDLKLPKMIMYMGEALPHGGREYIEETFGIPVLSRYNTVEAFKIGFFCEERTGFHLHEDLCHVRIGGMTGETVPTGEQGKIIISNLVNRATVLLNYPVGDLASLSLKSCSCGRTLRLLSELEGRVEDILPLADGRFIHPRAVWQVFKNDRDVLQYQLIQHELQRFELILVTKGEIEFQRALERALPKLEALLAPDAFIEANRRTDFARSSGSKFRAVASLCSSRIATSFS